MTSDELREIQAPFQAKYKASPETAVIHSCVTGASLPSLLALCGGLPATDEQVALLVKQTERYCMVYQTLLHPPVIETAVSRV